MPKGEYESHFASNSQKENKIVSWIELYFDLVFVAAAHLVALFMKSATAIDALKYLAVFVTLLLLWLSHTLYSSRFSSRGWFYHVITVLITCGIFGLIIQLHDAFSAYSMSFALTYAITKGLIILLYLKEIIKNPLRAVYILPFVIGQVVATIFWVTSIYIEQFYLFWVIALVIDIATPLYSYNLMKRIQVDTAHLPERLGLLTVIMLGEMIISLAISSSELTLTQPVLVSLIGGIGTVTIIFFAYFRFIEDEMMHNHNSQGYLFIYAHVPLYIGLVCMAAAQKVHLLGGNGMWLLIPGMFLFIVAFRAIKYIQEQYIPMRQIISVLCFSLFLLAYLLLSEHTVLQLAIVTLAFIGYLIISEFILTLFSDAGKANQFKSSKNKKNTRTQVDWNF
jgi:low temperature requirement protein LtrA